MSIVDQIFVNICLVINISQYIKTSMDYFFRLKKVLLQGKNHKEFRERLDLVRGKLSHVHLGQLLLILAKVKTANFSNYLPCLLQCGADINYAGGEETGIYNQSFLMLSCKYNSSENVAHILRVDSIDLMLEDSRKQNALLYALKNKDEEDSYEIVSSIISRNIGLINSISWKENTLLIQAIEIQSIRITEFLLKSGADPNIPSGSSKNSALHHSLAIFNQNPDNLKNIVLLLLNSGANPFQKNAKTLDAFDIAQRINFDLKRLYQMCQNNNNAQQKNIEQVKNSLSEQTITKDADSLSIDSNSSSEEDEAADIEKQIVDVYQEYQTQIQRAWSDISYLYQQLEKLGHIQNLSIQLIGSFATGLWSKDSDINIAYTNQNQQCDMMRTLKWLYSSLNRSPQKFGIKQSFINLHTKFPNIRITLTKALNCRQIDIVAFQKRNNGRKYVNFVLRTMTTYPEIQSFFYLIHKLLKSFNIHTPTLNGPKTYTLFLMIFKFIELYHAPSFIDLLFGFVNYYADSAVYRHELEETGEIKLYLDIIDPLNHANNTGGKKTDINKLQRIFKVVSLALKLEQDEQFLSGGLEYLYQISNCFKQDSP